MCCHNFDLISSHPSFLYAGLQKALFEPPGYLTAAGSDAEVIPETTSTTILRLLVVSVRLALLLLFLGEGRQYPSTAGAPQASGTHRLVQFPSS